MGKTVYSIVLDDDVVKGIDMMASRQGTSRSNMINRILAQHVSMPTAETMLNEVYNTIDELLRGHSSLAVQLLGSGSMINIRSALQYKYNPSVRYSLELFDKDKYWGQLKVSLRTQNSTLIEILDNFFYCWGEIEKRYCGIKSDEFSAINGRYTRLLRVCNCQNYSEAFAKYVDIFDKCLKEFFKYYSVSSANARLVVKQLYLTNINSDILNL